MKVSESSTSSIGTQIVVSMRRNYAYREEKRRVSPGDKGWPRYKAMATRIAAEKGIKGEFFCADVQPFIGGLVEVQLSWVNGESNG